MIDGVPETLDMLRAAVSGKWAEAQAAKAGCS